MRLEATKLRENSYNSFYARISDWSNHRLPKLIIKSRQSRSMSIKSQNVWPTIDEFWEQAVSCIIACEDPAAVT